MQYEKKRRFEQVDIEPLNEKSASLPQKKKLRIAYLSGPCDAPAVFKEWSEGKQADYFGTNYMGQFLQLAAELDADSYVITSLPGKYSICKKEKFIFENSSAVFRIERDPLPFVFCSLVCSPHSENI